MKVIDGGITAPMGFIAQGVGAQIKYKNRRDVAVIYSPVACAAAAVYTTNLVRAACLDICQKHLENGTAQAIVVNSGNANACTGEQGRDNAIETAIYAASLLNIEPHEVLVASTGVIGVQMPLDKVLSGVKEAVGSLSPEGSHNAAMAIMTTDLVKKEIAVQIELQGKTVTIGAIAKGSGMIHPNMATMLAFITTDASISKSCLQRMLKSSVDVSYNMISVDRDTSTNDMAAILANGLAGNSTIEDESSPDYQIFKTALDYVNTTLAKKIARDGEGANHLMEVQVIGAADQINARTIARSITGSNLTKTAIFGHDANWGRILAAAGYSGACFDPYRVDVYLGREKVAENGMGLQFDEARVRRELEGETVVITIDLKSGDGRATAWGCDLSYDYIKINADYRT
ncbi:MAG: bifunctional glutamate N-acetyltransferase/amino-acid acetyltransferase ArgJ [Syntrophomonadaceae bacterium]|jgi:glutamate N-acetyltransferase/amino-acid N-acetyltransferase